MGTIILGKIAIHPTISFSCRSFFDLRPALQFLPIGFDTTLRGRIWAQRPKPVLVEFPFFDMRQVRYGGLQNAGENAQRLLHQFTVDFFRLSTIEKKVYRLPES